MIIITFIMDVNMEFLPDKSWMSNQTLVTNENQDVC